MRAAVSAGELVKTRGGFSDLLVAVPRGESQVFQRDKKVDRELLGRVGGHVEYVHTAADHLLSMIEVT
jgi:hypothetical protein